MVGINSNFIVSLQTLLYSLQKSWQLDSCNCLLNRELFDIIWYSKRQLLDKCLTVGHIVIIPNQCHRFYDINMCTFIPLICVLFKHLHPWIRKESLVMTQKPALSSPLLSRERERECVCDLRFSFPFLTFGDLETDLDQERRHYIMCEQRACNKGIDMGVTLPSSQFQNVKFSKFKFFSTDFDLPIGWQ